MARSNRRPAGADPSTISPEFSARIESDLSDVHETLRYLRTFAVSIKISGAGIDEFSGFADEMLERIKAGIDRVEELAGQLDGLLGDIGRAKSLQAGSTTTMSAESVAGIEANLTEAVRDLDKHHQLLNEVAAGVAALARAVQGKVASALSAMQVGDMTRQRIEHIQSAIGLAADRFGSISRASGPFRAMLSAQMDDTIDEFEGQTRRLTGNIRDLGGDAVDIMRLREMAAHGQEDGGAPIDALDASVSQTLAMVRHVEAASRQSGTLSRAASAAGKAMAAGIDDIRAIKLEIQYMALNTNIRCGRIGDRAAPIKVITVELREFAARLDAAADSIIDGLLRLNDIASRLADGDAEGADSLGERLEAATSSIHATSTAVERNVAIVSREGSAASEKIASLAETLDFNRGLGELLSQCAELLAMPDGEKAPETPLPDDVTTELSDLIYRLYTMESERALHRRFLPSPDMTPDAASATAQDTVADDEDELDAILL